MTTLGDFIEKIDAGGEKKSPSESPVCPARLAVYDSPCVAPRVVELSADDYSELINLLATKTYQFSREKGGSLPFTIIKEVIENLIHAYFNEVIITILDNGNTIRISDQGPGIPDKERAFWPGFSTATREMKKYIRGVGSGLPIVKESLTLLGGAISIEDNLARGAVVTIRVPGKESSSYKPELQEEEGDIPFKPPRLSHRHKQVLSIILEFSSAGPSAIATSLGVSLSTVYRDLLYLEDHGLVASDLQGKRTLTPLGMNYLSGLSSL